MVDWYSILTKYGVDIPNEEQIVIHCPFHEDRKESCAINLDKGAWICFAGCGQGGLKSFIHKFTGKSWADIDADIGGQLDSSVLEINPLFFGDEEKEVSKELPYQKPEIISDIPDNHWIYKRGFTKQTILDWDCKTNNFLDFMIPAKDLELETIGWITRRTQAIPKYLFSKGFAKSKTLFGMDKIKNIDTLYLVEGALDCMWLSQHGYPSVAILGASISRTQIELLGNLQPHEVVLALDNDDAGRKGISKATLDIDDRFLISYLNIPKKYKDVQEIDNVDILHKVMNSKVLL